MEISLVHRITVGKKGGPAPKVYDLDWNPRPKSCKGKDAVAIIACLSSFGTHIYYYPRTTRKWTTMVIDPRPSMKGPSLQWHKDGNILASSSDPDGQQPGQLTILAYETNHMSFYPSTLYRLREGSKISSLTWTANGNNLIVATYPKTQITIYTIDKKTALLTKLGRFRFPHLFNNPVFLQAHPSNNFFFTCCPQATRILVWGKATSTQQHAGTGWIKRGSVHCKRGLHSMAFSRTHEGLVAIGNDYWGFWHFTDHEGDYLNLHFEVIDDEHRKLKGKSKKYRSGIISMAASKKGNLLASGGCGDTFIIHTKVPSKMYGHVEWQVAGSREGNVCYGKVECLKFNPADDNMMRIAMGGNSGFIHIWAVFKRTTSRVDIPEPKRRYEHCYYSKEDPDDADLEEDEDGDDKTVVELYEEVEVEYEEGKVEEEEVEVAGAEPQDSVDRGGKEQQQAEEGDGKSGEGGAGLSERFDDIAEEAQAILNSMEAAGDAPKERVKSLCRKIINAKDEICTAIKKDP